MSPLEFTQIIQLRDLREKSNWQELKTQKEKPHSCVSRSLLGQTKQEAIQQERWLMLSLRVSLLGQGWISRSWRKDGIGVGQMGKANTTNSKHNQLAEFETTKRGNHVTLSWSSRNLALHTFPTGMYSQGASVYVSPSSLTMPDTPQGFSSSVS